MISLAFNSAENMALVQNTIRERDPYEDCIVIGSAAIAAHFYEAEADCPILCSDVDALCSQGFFESQLSGLPSRHGVSKVQVRWPRGKLALRGATNMTVDIYPEDGEALLPFTVAHDMSDAWIRETYEDAREIAVKKAGIWCKPLLSTILQIARVGREKDIICLEKILPNAETAGVLSAAEMIEATAELEFSKRERDRYPNRYYARIDV